MAFSALKSCNLKDISSAISLNTLKQQLINEFAKDQEKVCVTKVIVVAAVS